MNSLEFRRQQWDIFEFLTKFHFSVPCLFCNSKNNYKSSLLSSHPGMGEENQSSENWIRTSTFCYNCVKAEKLMTAMWYRWNYLELVITKVKCKSVKYIYIFKRGKCEKILLCSSISYIITPLGNKIKTNLNVHTRNTHLQNVRTTNYKLQTAFLSVGWHKLTSKEHNYTN